MTTPQVVYTRRPGRAPLTCVTCGREIREGQRYVVGYNAVQRNGCKVTVSEPRHAGCRQEGEA